LSESAAKHQEEVAVLQQKHQKELAEAVALQMQERSHRERLENELANQQQELALCERLEKELLDGAQPQYQRQEVNNTVHVPKEIPMNLCSRQLSAV